VAWNGTTFKKSRRELPGFVNAWHVSSAGMRKPIYSELLKVTMWHAVMAGTVAFNLVVLVANYAACVQSFELLNSEKKPLGRLRAVRPTVRNVRSGSNGRRSPGGLLRGRRRDRHLVVHAPSVPDDSAT
jgi:hypothetical protein